MIVDTELEIFENQNNSKLEQLKEQKVTNLEFNLENIFFQFF
jgi:hypothetical protein